MGSGGIDPRIVVPAVVAQQGAQKRLRGIPLISDEEAERRQRAADVARRRRVFLTYLLVLASLIALVAWLVLDLVLSAP